MKIFEAFLQVVSPTQSNIPPKKRGILIPFCKQKPHINKIIWSNQISPTNLDSHDHQSDSPMNLWPSQAFWKGEVTELLKCWSKLCLISCRISEYYVKEKIAWNKLIRIHKGRNFYFKNIWWKIFLLFLFISGRSTTNYKIQFKKHFFATIIILQFIKQIDNYSLVFR